MYRLIKLLEEAFLDKLNARTLEEFGHRGECLELEEALLEHVFGVDLLDAHQVQDHVVREVERAVQRVRLALHTTRKQHAQEQVNELLSLSV